jgi:hypothetical protein
VTDLHDAWGRSLAFSKYSHLNVAKTKYILRPDKPLPEEDEKEWEAMLAAGKKAEKVVTYLIRYVREEYVEVNADAASETAWRDYVDSHEKNQKLPEES